MRNVLLNYFIYQTALTSPARRYIALPQSLYRATDWGLLDVCITKRITIVVNNLGLDHSNSQICMSFCKTSSPATETSYNSLAGDRTRQRT